MVQKSADVDAAFSNIDVDLQRRADLIPNLVASVKGYANVEETILTTIANARAGLMTAQTPDEKLAANDRLNVALLPLMRMQENYPQLKSNDQFMRLEDELAGTENRIAVSRLRYNAAIKDYNVFIQQFPNNVWAGMAGFHAEDGVLLGGCEVEGGPKGGLLEVGVGTNEGRPSRVRRPISFKTGAAPQADIERAVGAPV